MYKIIRFFNQNRKKIYKVILIIVFIIGIIQLLNALAKIENNSTNSNSVISDNNILDKELVSDKSAVSGEKVQTSKLSSETEVIKEFMQYCNDKNLKSAYELISDECKEEMFATIDDFKEIYYLPTFNGENKIYTMENWVGDIYKIEINDNMLSTGKYDKNNTIIDYITVEKDEDGEYKLNINNYIGKTSIDKEIEKNDIKIRAIEADTYKDYVIYTFEVTNNSKRTILLDSLSNIDTMYIEDSKGVKYSSYMHELSQKELQIGISGKRQIKIKYYSKYGSTKKMEKAVFSKVILDYEKYEYLSNKSQFDYSTLEIEI
ncbi:MAG: hypothetical protein IJE05_01270 [Clostridia bacterium]|nr:hypothetical protein [Clostridia bacterium]